MTAVSPQDATRDCTGSLAVDPFESLRVHFGMLMGVEDFDVLQAYARGKSWLHTAWLHRSGAIWGLEVSADVPELRVSRGLAVDGVGRELFLDRDACVHLGRWFEEHGEEHGLELDASGTIEFAAAVTIRAKHCAFRAVPALVEPCSGSGGATAYSRVLETVELRIEPYDPNVGIDWGDLPYRRLRIFFGLADAEAGDAAEAEASAARAAVLAALPEDRAGECLAWFRDLAAKDSMELAPAAADVGEAESLTPEKPPAPLVLAVVEGIKLVKQGDDWNVSIAEVDNTVRRTLVATSTLQELLCGCRCAPDEVAPDPIEDDEPDPDLEIVDAPQVDRASVEIDDESITFELTRSVYVDSVTPGAFIVSEFEPDKGWRVVGVDEVEYDGGMTITLNLVEPLSLKYVRLIVRGTGPTPLLDRFSQVPLTGALGEVDPTDPHDGKDFVHMEERSTS